MANRHTLLSDIHKLLGSYSPADFIEASRHSSVGESMREILRVLARESVSESRSKTSAVENRAALQAERPPDSYSIEDLVVSILVSEFGTSTQQLYKLAQMFELPIAKRPKESKERIARHIASKISLMPASERKKAVKVIRNARHSQTQGWLGVIKNSR